MRLVVGVALALAMLACTHAPSMRSGSISHAGLPPSTQDGPQATAVAGPSGISRSATASGEILMVVRGRVVGPLSTTVTTSMLGAVGSHQACKAWYVDAGSHGSTEVVEHIVVDHAHAAAALARVRGLSQVVSAHLADMSGFANVPAPDPGFTTSARPVCPSNI
jgi:hypothetical protein